ncbi:MAG: hypothetical protein NTZ59_05525, partial [Bacteroidetes bacterium]|nr:hypothetical protein [Bacteroidota bacterium]
MDITNHYTTIFRKLIALLTTFVLLINYSKAQNLLVNGDFESGVSGTGFQTQSPYNYLSTLSGNSNPGDYAIITDPNAMNTTWFLHCKDHTSGTGKMMVIDGITTGGQQRFWKAGNSGGGVGPLNVGTTYTFSYWVRSVSKSVTDINTTANIGIQFNNVASVTLTAGSTLLPFDTATGWVQVKYTFVPTNAYVNIEMYNNNTSAVGNDFALDDIAVLAPPLPLAVSYSLQNPTCYNNTDGYIIAYGSGGTAPYTYSFNGGVFSTTNTLTGLATSSHTVTVKDALLNTVSSSTINITAPSNPLTATASVNPICSGNNTTLTAANGGASYNWTASPVDASLTTPGIYNPVVSPAVATTYTVTSSTTTNVNLIYNGNFSLGNTGFTTDYTYKTVNTGGAQRCYGVMPNAQVFFNTFSTCGDHTTGTQNMYVVDGSLNSADKVWCQTVVVKPSTTYVFSYWIQTLTINNPAQIETKINGVTVPAGTSANPVNAPATVACGNWQQVSYSWTSGVGVTTAEICLYDKNVNGNGNDFALDDISFTGSYGCNLSKTITIDVNPPASTNNINLFDCNSVTYQGNTYTSNTIVRDTLKAVQGCDSVYKVANITVNSIIATNKTTNLASCKGIIYKGNTYTTSTVIKDTLKSFQGCDSVYNTVNITINSLTPTTKTQTLSSCKSIVYNGNTYAASTVLKDTVKSYQGCDSVYNVVNINPIATTTNTQTLSSCKSIIYKGNTYITSTVLKDTLKSFQGCDSIYNTVNITINPLTPTIINISASGCNSVVYKTITYTASTVLRDTVKSLQGCDSIYNIATITVKQPTSSTTTINTTAPYTWNGTTYSTSGTYIKTGFLNSVGCDSTATIILTIAPITTNPCWKMISTGFNHTIAIKKDGTLWAWGQNTYGQVGDGTNTHRNMPTQIGTDTNWESVSAKGFHTVAIKKDGTLWAWGQNSFGQVGDGTSTNRNVPVQIGTATNWAQISSGLSFTLALKKDSTLWAWGYNILGQLGDGTLVNKNTPIKIGNANNWVNIGTGEFHSAAIKADGTLWTWGSNSNGQLGDGTTVNKTTPTQIGTDNNWASFKGGNAHTIALKTDNTIWSWGSNNTGQLGDGTNISKSTPTQLGVANNWREINAGGGFSVALTTTGTIWSCGKNTNGQLGNGTAINNNILTKIGVDINWSSINAGDNHFVASKTDGSLWACGYNLYGQLGDVTNADKNLPKLVISGCSPCPVAVTLTQTLSDCKAIIYKGNTYNTSTILKDTIKSFQGCDSIYNIANINITPITTATNTQTLSSCKSIVYNGNTYAASTVLRDTVKSFQGCDSIYNIANINITPITTATNTQTLSSCK